MGNPPTLTDIFKSKIDKAENNEEEDDSREKEKEESKQGVKRKIDEFYEENVIESQTKNGEKMHDKHIKKAKNVGSLFFFFIFLSTTIVLVLVSRLYWC